MKNDNSSSEKPGNTIIATTSTPTKTITTTLHTNPLGSRNMVTGVKTIPRKTKSTKTDAQLEQNRSKENNRIQFEPGTRRNYERKT